jgi:hypothetical protein
VLPSRADPEAPVCRRCIARIEEDFDDDSFSYDQSDIETDGDGFG